MIIESLEDCILPLFPNGFPCLVFQTARIPACFDSGKTPGPLFLLGHGCKPASLMLKGPFSIITWFLYPHALTGFLHEEAHHLTNSHVDALLLHHYSSRLPEQLLNATSTEQRLQMVHHFLATRACPAPLRSAHGNAAAFGTRLIRQSKGLITVSGLQKEMNLTEKTLERAFRAEVGVTPRMYGRICQFNAAFQQLNQGRFTRLSDLAYHNGFSDQSHLIRTFREFTGFTPGAYLEASAPYKS